MSRMDIKCGLFSCKSKGNVDFLHGICNNVTVKSRFPHFLTERREIMYNYMLAFVFCAICYIAGEYVSNATKAWVPSVFVTAA